MLLDRYQAARHNVLVLGAIQQAEGKSKSNTHRSHKSKQQATLPYSPTDAHNPSNYLTATRLYFRHFSAVKGTNPT